MECLCASSYGLKSLTGNEKHSTLDVWDGYEFDYAEKQSRCKVSKKTLDIAKWNVNVQDISFEMIESSAWLRSVRRYMN